ncbi:MAG: hypothetical protein ACRYF3_04240 [Janthinobacterium lividum]
MSVMLWTPAEENQLAQELRDGLTVEDIADAHSRTVGAILARAAKMVPIDVESSGRDARVEWLREELLANPAYDWNDAVSAARTRRRDTARVRAPRTGRHWSKDEDAQILDTLRRGAALDDLALHLQRSPYNLSRRIKALTRPDQDTTSTPPEGATPAPTPVTTNGTDAPPAHGQPWTPQEVERLLEELRSEAPISEIARTHNRSVRAIHGRCAILLGQLSGKRHPLEEQTTHALREQLLSRAPAPAQHAPPSTGPAPTNSRPAPPHQEDDNSRRAVALVADLLGAQPIPAVQPARTTQGGNRA